VIFLQVTTIVLVLCIGFVHHAFPGHVPKCRVRLFAKYMKCPSPSVAQDVLDLLLLKPVEVKRISPVGARMVFPPSSIPDNTVSNCPARKESRPAATNLTTEGSTRIPSKQSALHSLRCKMVGNCANRKMINSNATMNELQPLSFQEYAHLLQRSVEGFACHFSAIWALATRLERRPSG
jgi:hypothetical protein